MGLSQIHNNSNRSLVTSVTKLSRSSNPNGMKWVVYFEVSSHISDYKETFFYLENNKSERMVSLLDFTNHIIMGEWSVTSTNILDVKKGEVLLI